MIKLNINAYTKEVFWFDNPVHPYSTWYRKVFYGEEPMTSTLIAIKHIREQKR